MERFTWNEVTPETSDAMPGVKMKFICCIPTKRP